ncbi:MAG: HD-GYP domain-containing protein [Fibrobacterota bacterium]
MNDTNEYQKVDRKYIESGDAESVFDIYIMRKKNNGQSEMVLLLSKGASKEDRLRGLDNKFFGDLYIQKDDSEKYYDYIAESVNTLLEDRSVPDEKKSEFLYKSTSKIVENVFSDPRSGQNIKRVSKVAFSMINFLLSDRRNVKSLLKIGSFDYYTYTHCVNVSVFSVGLAQMISGFTEDDLFNLAYGAMLHDIGKTAISGAIINKKEKLTGEEFEIIKTHPAKGEEMVRDYVPEAARDIVYHHHEKFNGSGYPEGLKGLDISEGAKISTIADVYDALTTNRSYARARNPFDAVMLMKQEMVGSFAENEFLAFINFLGGRPATAS